METPRRKISRNNAHEHQIAQAQGMKKRATQVEEEFKVGSIAQAPLKDCDAAKIDSSNLSLVVAELVTSREKMPPKYMIVCKRVSLKICMPEVILSLFLI